MFYIKFLIFGIAIETQKFSLILNVCINLEFVMGNYNIQASYINM